MANGKLTMVGDSDKRAARIHDLVKAPANAPWAQERKNSWDAKDPATVYYTPETLADGTPTTALTVILRTKGCHWWWSSGCTFCGYFNDTRDDVTSENLHAQWNKAKADFDDFKKLKMVKVYTSGSLLEDREIPVDFQETVLTDFQSINSYHSEPPRRGAAAASASPPTPPTQNVIHPTPTPTI